MLFRHFKTGLAVGLTALLFSSGSFLPHAEAGTLGGGPGVEDMDGNNQRTTLTRLMSRTIATEIFDGSGRTNSDKEFVTGDVHYLFERALRNTEVDIDLTVSGAEFHDTEATGAFYRTGYVVRKSVVVSEETAGEPVMGMRDFPLYLNVTPTGGVERSEAVDEASDLTGTDDTNDAEAILIVGSDGEVYQNMAATPADITFDESDFVMSGPMQTVFEALIPFSEADNAAVMCQGEAVMNGMIMDHPRSDTTLRFRECEAPEARMIKFSGITLTNADESLADHGGLVTLAAEVRYSDDDSEFDSAPGVAVLRSLNTIEVSIDPAARVGVDPYSDPAFTEVINPGGASSTEAMLGQVNVKVNATQKEAAGSSVSVSELIESADIMVDHGVLTDDAFHRVYLGEPSATNRTYGPSRGVPIEDGAATFTVRHDIFTSADQHDIYVTFDGETAISSWDAGTASVSFMDRGRGLLVPPGAEGALAPVSRGGLSTQLNMAQSTYGDGATRYQSFVRIANNGVTEGFVTVHIYNSATGERLGQWESPDIPAGGSIQVSAAQLENHLGYTPTGPDQYDLRIEGGINGYVQHVMWNSVDGLFSDLSGFRVGGGLNTTP